MKTIKITITVIAMGVVLSCLTASCNKNDSTEDNVLENGFRATIEQQSNGNDHRTHINPGTWDVGTPVDNLWSSYDQILVANHGGESGCDMLTFRLTEGMNTTSGTFKSRQENEAFYEPDYVAIYPATNAAGEVNNIGVVEGTLKATFNLPATQVYNPNSFAEKAMPMVAYTETRDMAFKNVLGGIASPSKAS